MDPSRAPPGSGTNLNTFNTAPDDSSPAHHTRFHPRYLTVKSRHPPDFTVKSRTLAAPPRPAGRGAERPACVLCEELLHVSSLK
eukprot:7376895-Prymnesium_polylepis.1